MRAVEGAPAQKFDSPLDQARQRLLQALMQPFEVLADRHAGTVIAQVPDVFLAALEEPDEGRPLAVFQELLIEVAVAQTCGDELIMVENIAKRVTLMGVIVIQPKSRALAVSQMGRDHVALTDEAYVTAGVENDGDRMLLARQHTRTPCRIEPPDCGGEGSDEDCCGWLHRVEDWNSG